ncbi:hypothetical protein ACSNN7_01085 [Micromonospora sp. URMC 105]|uniref:hypothetical protein n=1 Tax=Micromonospora sp. URMC 105 TaxID=3423413 RepID=UPI003F1B7A19
MTSDRPPETKNLCIVATPPTHPDMAAPPDDNDAPSDIDAWFGDDLTDTHLPSDTATTAPDSGSLAEATSLIVACWPLDADDPTNRIRLAWLLTACARLLRPGGCLVLVVTVFSPTRSPSHPRWLSTAMVTAISRDTDGCQPPSAAGFRPSPGC